MVRLAVTGGIACGKSAVGSILASRGIPVCEADALAHDVMRSGSPVHDAVVAAFGRDILDAEGEIDRARLGERVFADDTARLTLNGIVHPAVGDGLTRWLRAQAGTEAIAAAVIPLFYEVEMSGGWDAVVCVVSRKATQLRRLRERGLNAAQAEARIRAQLPIEHKTVRADHVILNEGGMDGLEEQTMRVIGRVLEKR